MEFFLMMMMMFIFGFISLVLWSSSMLNMLLSLEMMMFGLYMGGLVFFMPNSMVEMVLFLIFVVCEAVIGLVIFLLKLYYSGKDYIVMSFI